MRETLPVTLRVDEITEYGRILASFEARIVELELEKKAEMARFKDRIDDLRAEISVYATRINDGWEHRSVEVEKRPNYTTKQWEFTRMDTGEIYKTKAMSFDDLQVAFPFLDAEKLNNSAPEEAQDQPDDGGMLNGKMSTVSGFVPQPRIPELTTATEQ